MEVLSKSAPPAVERTADGVVVTLVDGRTVEGSHALLAVGSVPNTAGLGLEEAGVELSASGHIQVDQVSRTSAAGVYAAGDCTGCCPWRPWRPCRVASPCGTRSATPCRRLNVRGVAANVFTEPEIATVGISQNAADVHPPVEPGGGHQQRDQEADRHRDGAQRRLPDPQRQERESDVEPGGGAAVAARVAGGGR